MDVAELAALVGAALGGGTLTGVIAKIAPQVWKRWTQSADRDRIREEAREQAERERLQAAETALATAHTDQVRDLAESRDSWRQAAERLRDERDGLRRALDDLLRELAAPRMGGPRAPDLPPDA